MAHACLKTNSRSLLRKKKGKKTTFALEGFRTRSLHRSLLRTLFLAERTDSSFGNIAQIAAPVSYLSADVTVAAVPADGAARQGGMAAKKGEDRWTRQGRRGAAHRSPRAGRVSRVATVGHVRCPSVLVIANACAGGGLCGGWRPTRGGCAVYKGGSSGARKTDTISLAIARLSVSLSLGFFSAFGGLLEEGGESR